MEQMTDKALIEQHRQGRRDGFAELVHRHIDWVYSAAKRRVGSTELAEDVTQAIFIALAKSPPERLNSATLSPWLFGVLIRTCKRALRAQATRRHHETQAAKMRPTTTNDPQADWNSIAPDLEEAVAKLRFADQQAILLRFYEQLGFAEVAETLGITEEAARKRVSRATERLRGVLTPTGVNMPAAALAGLLTSELVAPAPTAIAAAVAERAGVAGSGLASLKATLPAGLLLWSVAALVAVFISAGVMVSGVFQLSSGVPVAVTPIERSPIPEAVPEEVRMVIARLRATEERLRTIEYDATSDIADSSDAARAGSDPLHPLRIRQTQHILQAPSSRATWMTRDQRYADPSLNKIISARTLRTASILAYWDVGNRTAQQVDLAAPAHVVDGIKTHVLLRAGSDPLRHAYVVNMDTEAMLTFPGTRVTVSGPSSDGGQRLLKVAVSAKNQEGIFCAFEMDPDKGFLVTHFEQYGPKGSVLETLDLEASEVVAGIWVPKRIKLMDASLKQTTVIEISNVKMNPDLSESRFGVQAVMQLPNETYLYRTLADGSTKTDIVKFGMPVARETVYAVNRVVTRLKATTRSLLDP